MDNGGCSVSIYHEICHVIFPDVKGKVQLDNYFMKVIASFKKLFYNTSNVFHYNI